MDGIEGGEGRGERREEGWVEAMRSPPPPRAPARGIHPPEPIPLASREARDSSEEKERKQKDEEWKGEEEEGRRTRSSLSGSRRGGEEQSVVVETHPPSLDRSPSLKDAREERGEGEDQEALTFEEIGEVCGKRRGMWLKVKEGGRSELPL